MMMTILLMDVAPVGGGITLAAGVVFFLIFVAVAFIAFKLLKKTVGMAVRMFVVFAILAIALVGSIALYMFGRGGSGPRPPRPIPTRTR
jgi:hypothetical protein